MRGCRGLKALLLRGCTQVQRHASGQPVPLAVAVILVPDMFSHLGSIPLSFPPSAQLEDEALKHIQHHCHELVSLNLQSCSVSTDPGRLRATALPIMPASRCTCAPAARHTCVQPHCLAAHAQSGWQITPCSYPDSSFYLHWSYESL